MSSLLFYISRKKNRKVRIIIDCIALFLPCLLAGLRANCVGTDVSVYLEPMFNLAINTDSFKNFLAGTWYQGWYVRGVADIEIGFSILVFFVAKVFKNMFVLQFIIQFLTIVPIYIGLRIRKEENLWIGMTVYFCMFYNISLNIMRQLIAISILFLALQYFLEDKKKLFLLYSFIACSFHNVAILGFLLPFLYKFINLKLFKKGNSFKKSKFKLYILTICGLILVLTQNLIIDILNSLGLSWYVHYITGEISFLPNQIIIRLPLLFMCLIFRKELFRKEGDLFFFHCCCIIYAIIFSQFASVNSYAYRIAMIFSIFLVDFIPKICSVIPRVHLVNLHEINYNKLFMLLYLGVWWLYYCVLTIDSSMPYVLGI